MVDYEANLPSDDTSWLRFVQNALSSALVVANQIHRNVGSRHCVQLCALFVAFVASFPFYCFLFTLIASLDSSTCVQFICFFAKTHCADLYVVELPCGGDVQHGPRFQRGGDDPGPGAAGPVLPHRVWVRP